MQVEVGGGGVHHSFKISDRPDIIQLWKVDSVYQPYNRGKAVESGWRAESGWSKNWKEALKFKN